MIPDIFLKRYDYQGTLRGRNQFTNVCYTIQKYPRVGKDFPKRLIQGNSSQDI